MKTAKVPNKTIRQITTALIAAVVFTLAVPTSPCWARGGVSDASEETAANLLRGLASRDKAGKFNFARPLPDIFYPTPDSPGYSGAATFISASILNLKCAGQNHLVLLASFKAEDDVAIIGGEITVMAIYKKVGGQSKLIAAGNVQDDRFTSVAIPPILPYASNAEALLIANTHSNAGESYESLNAVALQGNKLVSLCSGVGDMYSGRNSEKSLEESGKFVVGKSTGAGPRPLYFVSTVTFNKYDPETGDKVLSSSRKVFRIPLHYSKGKYSAVNGKTMQAYRRFIKSTGMGLED